jgi:hypothetical protein
LLGRGLMLAIVRAKRYAADLGATSHLSMLPSVNEVYFPWSSRFATLLLSSVARATMYAVELFILSIYKDLSTH